MQQTVLTEKFIALNAYTEKKKVQNQYPNLLCQEIEKKYNLSLKQEGGKNNKNYGINQ